MARITKILEAKIKLQIECDCGNKFPWIEGGNQVCLLCHTKYELVMGPRKKQEDKVPDMALNPGSTNITPAAHARLFGKKVA